MAAELGSSLSGGNGRTSRALSYLVMCARLGYRIPGTHTIPEQIVAIGNPAMRHLTQPIKLGLTFHSFDQAVDLFCHGYVGLYRDTPSARLADRPLYFLRLARAGPVIDCDLRSGRCRRHRDRRPMPRLPPVNREPVRASHPYPKCKPVS